MGFVSAGQGRLGEARIGRVGKGAVWQGINNIVSRQIEYTTYVYTTNGGVR